MEGAAPLSFGITIHNTFKKFMQYMLQLNAMTQVDLFGTRLDKIQIPKKDLLEKFYEESWIDDWFSSKQNKEEYRSTGRRYLNNFYDKILTDTKLPKYLEQAFRLNLGKYKFKGRIDRADKNPDGSLDIVDYKTGQVRSKLEQVDKDQLLIYQWAATEHLKEKVSQLTYWYLEDLNALLPFKGTEEEIAKLKTKLLETIDEIIETIQTNNFYETDLKRSHDCRFRHLENHR
jgi:hypothetical protein